MYENNNKKKKISPRVLWTRIVCAFLALLMVAGVAYLSVQLIVESVKKNKAEKEADTTTSAMAAVNVLDGYGYDYNSDLL